MPLSGGAFAYMAGTERSKDSSSTSSLHTFLNDSTITTTPTTTTSNSINFTSSPYSSTSSNSNSIFPDSPPSSAPSSPSLSESTKPYSNPLYSSLNSPSTPIKPLLTPRSSSTSSTSSSSLSVLSQIFPFSSPIHSLPSLTVDLSPLSSLPAEWSAVVSENKKMGTRTLFVEGGDYEGGIGKESVCEVLELAEEKLGCTGVVVCLRKNVVDLGKQTPFFDRDSRSVLCSHLRCRTNVTYVFLFIAGNLLHSLMYVGGTITSSTSSSYGNFPSDPSYILVGLDL